VPDDEQSMVIDDNAVVSISYKLENGHGELLDSSQGQLPLVYMHNTNAILSSLERELTGSRKGDALDVVIYPEDAYGYANEELITELPKSHFEDLTDLAVGLRIKATNKQDDDSTMMTVKEIRDDTIVVDTNHPLAGQVLHFSIAVVAVREPTEAELAQGYATSTNPPA